MRDTLINFISLIVKSVWRVHMGRWYILRDVPLWFLRDIMEASWTSARKKEKEKPEGIILHLYAEAEKELNRRRFNAERFGKLDEFEKEWQKK